MRIHANACPRCQQLLASDRSTWQRLTYDDVAEPSSDLTERIMRATLTPTAAAVSDSMIADIALPWPRLALAALPGVALGIAIGTASPSSTSKLSSRTDDGAQPSALSPFAETQLFEPTPPGFLDADSWMLAIAETPDES